MAKTPVAKKPSQTTSPGDGRPANVVIKDKNGNEQQTHGYIKDGATYDKDGNIYASNHTGSGSVDTGNGPDYTNSGKWQKDYDNKTDPPTITFTEKPDEKKTETKKKKSSSSGSSSSYSSSYSPPSPPPPPPFVKWDEPVPTFKSDLKKINQYSYFSGVDKLEARNMKVNKECCFISKTITVGNLNDDQYIELDVSYSCDDSSSIEFYIIDGANEIPIVPIRAKVVKNEKLFFDKDTRFEIDKTKPITIKNKDSVTTYTLEEAIKKDGEYNATYTPSSGFKYKPFNEGIKVKVVMRTYELRSSAPYVKSIKIRTYGGDAL